MTVLVSNFKRIFSKPMNIVIMLVVPIVLNLIIITAMSRPSKFNVAVYAEEDTQLTRHLIAVFENKYNVQILDNIDLLKESVLSSYSDYGVTFPDGMTEAALKGNIEIKSFVRQDSESIKVIDMFFTTYMTAVGNIGIVTEGNEADFYSTLEEFEENKLEASYKYYDGVSNASIDNAISSLGYIAVGMVYFIITATMLIFEDKKFKVYSRILSSPVSRFSYLAQHLLSYLCLATIQVVIVLLLIPRIVNVSYGTSLAQNLGVFGSTMLFAATCIAIGVLISTVSKNTATLYGIVSMINVPMLMLGGCFWPASIMPVLLQKIGSFMPTAWFLKSARDVLQGDPISSYVGWMIIQAVFTILLLLIASFAAVDKKGRFAVVEDENEKQGEK